MCFLKTIIKTRDHQPWELNALQMKQADIKTMKIQIYVVCSMSESSQTSLQGRKSPHIDLKFPWIPLGQQPVFRLLLLIHLTFSVLVNKPFYSIHCQIMYIPGKVKPFTHIFSLEQTRLWYFDASASRYFRSWHFSLLWPPECCCSIRRGLLLISPRLLRKSGRCN